MKTKTIIGISMIAAFVFFAIVIAGSYLSSSSVSTNENSVENRVNQTSSSNIAGQLSSAISLGGAYPSPIEKILVYRDVPTKLTRDDIISLGKKFGITTTGTIKDGPQGWGIASDDLTIRAYLFNSGTIEFHNTNRYANVNPLDVPGKLPSDAEAIEIATNFLRERDLLPEGAFFKRVEHGKMTQLVKDAEDIVTWEDVQVWYGRNLNGLEVKGTKISIDIGGNGDVIDFYSNWRVYEPFMELPLIDPEQAFAELKLKGMPVDTNRQQSVMIDSISLAYLSKPGSQQETYLEPVWVFSGNVMENGKIVRPVVEYIPALTDEAVKSLPS
ncbi:MAG: hypothetical protein A4E35_02143 [Methanoregula sp. PtaU1.Bin051]|nr:MAG: hypothetical protein A4E35_02143 [Methanoregula sp. PtaU1.Bin051]